LKKEKKATEFSIEREIEVTILIMIMVMKRGIAIPPLKFPTLPFLWSENISHLAISKLV